MNQTGLSCAYIMTRNVKSIWINKKRYGCKWTCLFDGV